MIRILLVDDHEIVRTGLKLFINNLIPHSVIDEAGGGNSTLEKIKINDYQLIIMDLNMPGTSSFELFANMISSRPAAKILIFSINPENVHAKRYLQLGAKGYVNKNASPLELGNAIIAILENRQYISPSLAQAFAGDSPGEMINPFNLLSGREFEVLQLLIKGETLSDIRYALHLKSSTVSTYKGRILEKLKCKNILELNQLARVYNIIPLE